MGDLLRLGRDLQPDAAGGGTGARPAEGREPPRDRCRSDRVRQSGLHPPDRRPPSGPGNEAADLSPCRAARSLHPGGGPALTASDPKIVIAPDAFKGSLPAKDV